MSKAELIASVMEKSGADIASKASATRIVNNVFEAIAESLEKGDSVQLVGFGTFNKVKRKARDGHNPQTGKKMKIPASNTVKFKAGKALKDRMN